MHKLYTFNKNISFCSQCFIGVFKNKISGKNTFWNRVWKATPSGEN